MKVASFDRNENEESKKKFDLIHEAYLTLKVQESRNCYNTLGLTIQSASIPIFVIDRK